MCGGGGGGRGEGGRISSLPSYAIKLFQFRFLDQQFEFNRRRTG